ncbi:MAG TPA: peptidase [Gammaproteobacteria bacterium]|jgi:hypothetical protein|nr:peptidase [Gammaproteobacteria bacterium]
MAALDLPDGTARAAFAAVGADPDAFADAVTQQYTDALSAIGVSGKVMQAPIASVGPRSVVFRAKPSVSTLMRKLKDVHQRDASMPLLGAHVLLVISGNAHGVGVRALRAQHIDPVALADAAEQILAGHPRV